MATPNVGILTNAGKNLIDQVNAGQTKITFSKIAFSSMDNSQLTDDQVKALTAITPQEVVVDNPEITLDNNTGETRIRATGTNEALTDGVYVKTYAIYAKDDSGNEILYGITVSPNPNYLPEYDGVTPQAVTYSYKVNISNTSNITFTNSNDVYVSETDLSDALQPYAKTVDVNQQLDKKVTDNKDGTEQLNGVQIQPFNKLTDVEDHRNYLTGTANDLIILANASNFNFYRLFYPLVPGKKYTFSSEVTLTGTTNNIISARVYQSDGNSNTAVFNDAFIADGTRQSWTFVCPPNGYYLFVYAGVTGKTANIGATFHHSQLELGLPTPWHESIADKQENIGYTPADDSKVAHLSGANNFDTVPTVNDNPLLLASSLPSDLARTGQAQTFTEQQTFSIAPVINDASTDKGDNQAATMADLKSVADSAWCQLSITNESNEVALCRIDGNKLWVFWSFSRSGDNNYKSYSIGEIPSSIQGKKFNGFNSNLSYSGGDVYQPLNQNMVVSGTSIIVSYSGYPDNGYASMYGYFTFK